MPLMNGLEATRQIRSTHAMTANANVVGQERCLAAGMDYFVTKPITPAALYVTLARHLMKYAAGRFPGGVACFTASQAVKPVSQKRLPGNPDVIDMQVLAALFEDRPTKINKFAKRFLETAWQGINEIETALAQQDLTLSAALGHKTKSAARTVGAMRFGDLSHALELAQENGGIEFARKTIPQLRPLLEKIEEEINSTCVPCE